MSSRRRYSRILQACGVVLLLTLTAWSLPTQRVVAVGDVHGDLDDFTSILRQAGIIDARNHWIGGRTTLVQLGDLLDRGAQSRAVLDLMMDLEKQAPRAGGRVVPLLGNHEVMNLMGDLRYTSVEEFASYADADSSGRRQKALSQFRAWSRRHGIAEFTLALQSEWLEQHPLGYVEQRAAMGEGGKYGRWLRQHPALYKTADTVFVHGGLSPAIASQSVGKLNDGVAAELELFDQARALLLEEDAILPFSNFQEILKAAQDVVAKEKSPVTKMTATPAEREAGVQRVHVLQALLKPEQWLTVGPAGPLWFRGLAEWGDAEGASKVEGILQAQQAARIVVGHSTHEGSILSRWNGRVFLIDTGLNAAYSPGGRSSALEIDDGQVTAIYPDSRVVLVPKAANVAEPVLHNGGGQEPQAQTTAAPPRAHVWLGPDDKPLPFKNDDEILDFLKTANVVEDKGISVGVTGARRLLLEKDGVRAHAAWRQVDEEKMQEQLGGSTQMFFRDSYIFEPAAYELGRLLGMKVPPATLRTYRGTHGSIQLWVEKGMTDMDRQRKKIEPPDVQAWNKEARRMMVFDQLIYNTDRNQGNIIITENWEVWLIDHTRAFRRIGMLLPNIKLTQCERTLFEKMKALDEPTLKQRLGPYLRDVEIKMLLKRRDIIVKTFTKMAAEKGEDQVFYTMDPPKAESNQ